jgi:hypothetical protein
MADELDASTAEAGGVTVTFAVSGIDELLARIPGDARRTAVASNALRRITLAIEAAAKAKVRKRTGNTARSITSSVNRALLMGSVGDFGPLAGGSARTGLWLERGTGAFGPLGKRIFPLHAKVMRWPAGQTGPGGTLALSGRHTTAATRSGAAQWAVARSIAGMRAQPWLMPAYETVLPTIPAILGLADNELFGTVDPLPLP